MPRINAANNARTTLTANINSSVTSFSVVDGSAFPVENFIISINDEIMFVGTRSSNTFSSITRGTEGTSPAAHSAGDRVENRFTAGTAKEMWDDIESKETPAGAQAKATAAETAAKAYTDSHEAKTATHGATAAATANRIILRDASGRAKVAAPSASDDIARKAEVDTVQGNLDAHKADYVQHTKATMPHLTADGGFRWGLRINQDLSATLLFEEVE